MTRHQRLLANLIETLVEEWGHEEVQRTLAQLSDGTRVTPPERGLRTSGRPKKPTAVEQISKLGETGDVYENLHVIATKFDRKEFLPSVADVREFLAMMGENVGIVKDRSDAFRRLLHSLSKLPSDRLEHLARSTSHSGPAQLGPLSDAIKSTGDSLRRSEGPTPELEENS
jgi:hypothetical protein